MSGQTIKFAYNFCCGHYALTEVGITLYNDLARQRNKPNYVECDIDGTFDPIYIEVVEHLDKEATGFCPPEIGEIDINIMKENGFDENTTNFQNLYDFVINQYMNTDTSIAEAIDDENIEEVTDCRMNVEAPTRKVEDYVPVGGTPLILTKSEAIKRRKP